MADVEPKDDPAPHGKTSASRGAMWSAADFWVQQVTQLLNFVLVGNILGPSVVGVMTMALVATLFLATFLENGLTDALIQRAELREDHFDSAFWLMIALAGAEALLLCAASPIVAAFFSEPQLRSMLPMMAIGLPFIGVTACCGAMLQRQLKFRQLAIRSIIAYSTGFAVSVGMAYSGFGVYSLVGFFLTTRILDAIMILVVSDRRPGFNVSRPAALEIIAYGKHRVTQQVLGYITNQFDRLIIGYFLGAAALGLYAIADRLVFALINGISGVFQRVAFPVLSSFQHDRVAFERVMRDFLTATNVVSLPVFIGLAMTSHQLIGVLFTDKWDGVAPLMICMCAIGVFHASTYMLTTATNALGHPKIVVKLGFVVLAVRIIAGFIGVQFSVVGVAVANAVAVFTTLPMILIATNFLFYHRWTYLFSECWRPLIAAGVMVVALFGVEMVTVGFDDLSGLVTRVIAGVASYALALKFVAPEIFGKALTMVLRRS